MNGSGLFPDNKAILGLYSVIGLVDDAQTLTAHTINKNPGSETASWPVRADDGRCCGAAGLIGTAIIGLHEHRASEGAQQMRKILDLLRHQMRDHSVALDPAGEPDQPPGDRRLAVSLEQTVPDHDIRNAMRPTACRR